MPSVVFINAAFDKACGFKSANQTDHRGVGHIQGILDLFLRCSAAAAVYAVQDTHLGKCQVILPESCIRMGFHTVTDPFDQKTDIHSFCICQMITSLLV